MSALWDIISITSRSRDKFKAVQGDTERYNTVTSYGWRSIIGALLIPFGVLLPAYGMASILNSEHDWMVALGFVLIVILAILALYALLFLYPLSIQSAVRQCKLARKAIGIVGLVLNILTLILTIVLLITWVFA